MELSARDFLAVCKITDSMKSSRGVGGGWGLGCEGLVQCTDVDCLATQKSPDPMVQIVQDLEFLGRPTIMKASGADNKNHITNDVNSLVHVQHKNHSTHTCYFSNLGLSL